jgi:hypothetical protein
MSLSSSGVTDEVGGSSSLSRRLGVQGERVHRACQFRGECGINHAMAFDPALPFEGFRHNINPEVRLAAGSVAGVPLMQM